MGTDLAWLGWCHPHMQTLAVLPSQLASQSHWGRNWGVSWAGEVAWYARATHPAHRGLMKGANAAWIKKKVWKLCFYSGKEGTLSAKVFSSSIQLFCSNHAYQSVYRLAEMALHVDLHRQRGRERIRNCRCNTLRNWMITSFTFKWYSAWFWGQRPTRKWGLPGVTAHETPTAVSFKCLLHKVHLEHHLFGASPVVCGK